MTRALFCHLFFSFRGRKQRKSFVRWNHDSRTSFGLSVSLQSTKLLKWEISWMLITLRFSNNRALFFCYVNWLRFIFLVMACAVARLKSEVNSFQWQHWLTLIAFCCTFSRIDSIESSGFAAVINLKRWVDINLLQWTLSFEESQSQRSFWCLFQETWLLQRSNFIKEKRNFMRVKV